jgi:hypothetical protein
MNLISHFNFNLKSNKEEFMKMVNFNFLGKNIFQMKIFIMDKLKIKKCMEWDFYFKRNKINGCQEYSKTINLFKQI